MLSKVQSEIESFIFRKILGIKMVTINKHTGVLLQILASVEL